MKVLSCPWFFDNFASESRLAIIRALWRKGRSVQEICKRTGLEQSNVSHQLRAMRRCHLVKVRAEGKRRIYELESSVRTIIRACENHVKKHCKHRCEKHTERKKSNR